MVNPIARGAGEGNSKGDKGKGKMVVMEDNSDKGKMIIKTSNSKDDILLLPDLDLQSYGTLAESLHKQMLEVKAWKERSSEVKEEKEEEESPAEWEEPLAVQLQELLIQKLRDCFQTAIKKIGANGYSMEQAEWGVLNSGFYMGNYYDITSNIVAATMAFLAKQKKEFDPSKHYMFENVESLANYALVEMVNVVKQVKPYLTVADAMWLLFLFNLNLIHLIQAAWEAQSVNHFSSTNPKRSSSSSSTKEDMFLQKGMMAGKKKNTVFDMPAVTTIVPELEGGKRGRKVTGKAPASSRKVTMKMKMKTQSSRSIIIISEKKPAETPKITEKDEMLAALTQRKKQLEVELQGWRDWTSTKVGQAAQKLMRNNEQKKILRQDKEAAGADKWTHNAKNISELDVALNNAKYMMETATTTHLKLQEEHTMLLKKLEDSKLAFLSPNQNLQEIKLREQELLKQCSKLEAEIRFLQEDLARLKPESAKLQQQIDKARKREHEFEILRQNEEREKIKLLEKAESLRRERQEMNEKAKMEEDKLIAKTEENRVKYEECMKELRARISASKLGPESSSSSSSEKATAAEMKRREKECVMCLSVDRTVGLLPCAHLAFCEECSELHERLGMNDCPTCRTLIMQRIRVRFPPPKAQPKSHENRKLA